MRLSPTAKGAVVTTKHRGGLSRTRVFVWPCTYCTVGFLLVRYSIVLWPTDFSADVAASNRQPQAEDGAESPNLQEGHLCLLQVPTVRMPYIDSRELGSSSKELVAYVFVKGRCLLPLPTRQMHIYIVLQISAG
jgi:hypothetical protein